MPRPRRSNRASGARTKYTDDPFEIAGVSDESDGGNVSSRRKGKTAVRGSGSSDEDFKVANDKEDEEDEEEDQDESDVEMVSENDNDRGEDGPVLHEEEVEIANPQPKRTPSSQARVFKKRQADGMLALKDDDLHSRGIRNPSDHVGKVIHLQSTFGVDEKNLLSVVYARDRWHKGIDSAFPTRASLNEAQTLPDYGYGLTFGVEPDEAIQERTRGWDWYYTDDVGGRLRKRQRTEHIDETEARQVYFLRPNREKHTVFIGPVNDQTRFDLGQQEVLNFGEAWGKVKNEPPATKETKEDGAAAKKYLAAVSPISDDQKEAYSPSKDSGSSAVLPSPPYPCVLQLWSFKAKRENSLTKALDMKSSPRLRLGLCTNWGDLRRIAWCPIPRDSRDEDEEEALKNVGLLAGIWGDGYLRVIDVKLSRDPNTTEFQKVQTPIFEAKPASTVCTCVGWLSPTDIAVGCANGFVAIWSILPSPDAPSNPIPYFYHPIHSTYILNVASAYPTNPHLLSTTSMDGETRMISIMDPQKDVVETTRMRMGSAHLSYSPFLQSFLSTDENDFVRLLATRRFFTTTAVARLPSTISAHAPSSPWHPSALYGCTGGAVYGTNPLRRLLHTKEKQWQQAWFTHEWVGGQSSDSDSPGISRFHDGYRAESVSLLRNMLGDRKLINGTVVVTIFEEGTHVTALSWNPNQAYAGWASAGLGCGLIRVEDLAI
ncbi:hypothetical protein FE257_006853 [Aspergillus nanangensis]|uniref:Transcription factor TFIIIC complex subunit Tfc6 n=1 Tax=Aspergillus nanangensis TaxID=2582783 RepID=A0AAD4GTV6_ASPNN|nr:hypothetical protein FE257_006853 [Aspergillus nanangensis]